MYSTALLFRIAKVVSIFSIGLMALVVVIGNTTDYYTNYQFVEHVFKMDTTFPDSTIHYRSIDNDIMAHVGYIVIIALQTLMAFCCLIGSWMLLKNIKKDAITFHESKKWAILGLILAIIIWFLGFQVVGGEWFAMWQSSIWNGLGSAERIITFVVLVLILFQLKEEEFSS